MNSVERMAFKAYYIEPSIVKVGVTASWFLLILNIILPGVGSMISSFCGSKFNSTALLYGVLQLLTAAILIGWIWSIYHGCLIHSKAKSMLGGLLG